jgi:DNA helicase-2/ATP-dependent DNA helicase PcrA
MTRAKDELTLTCARRRMSRGIRSSQVASPFLDEIGREGVTFEETTAAADRGHRARRAVSRSRGGFYADVDERAAIEAAEDAADTREGPPHPPEYERLVVNARVRHPSFGEGKVLALRNHWPETRAEILFDDSGPKTIWLKYTRLEVLEDWP